MFGIRNKFAPNLKPQKEMNSLSEDCKLLPFSKAAAIHHTHASRIMHGLNKQVTFKTRIMCAFNVCFFRSLQRRAFPQPGHSLPRVVGRDVDEV